MASADEIASTHGSEYTAEAYTPTRRRLGVIQSMGRVGSALDNAAAEAFNSIVKVEYIHRHRSTPVPRPGFKIATWIVDFYYARRWQSACDGMAPIDYERLMAEARSPKPHNRVPHDFWGLTSRNTRTTCWTGAVKASREELRLAIVTCIEATYRRRRRQARLGRLTPIEFETLNPAATAACP